MPQLYWELDHKSASYRVLVEWWSAHAGKNRHLYIGQDVMRTAKKSELTEKMKLVCDRPAIGGVCWWPAYSLFGNPAGVADSLSTIWHPAPSPGPLYPWIESKKPESVKGLRPISDKEFRWKGNAPEGKTSDVVKYAVYRFDSMQDMISGEEGTIVSVTPSTSYRATEEGVYAVTAINRANNESELSDPIVIH